MLSTFSIFSIDAQPAHIIYICDMLGVIACSFAGTLQAKHKDLDATGCLLIAMVNAIGGGTARDVMLNRHPLFWMTDLNYFWVIFITSVLVQLFFYKAHKIESLITLFDALGLATFTLIGLKVALLTGAQPVIAALMGITTAVLGGLCRDIICNEIPLVLKREIYITAGIIGAIYYLSCQDMNMPVWVLDFSCIGLIFSIRMLAVRFDWHLPDISLKKT